MSRIAMRGNETDQTQPMALTQSYSHSRLFSSPKAFTYRPLRTP